MARPPNGEIFVTKFFLKWASCCQGLPKCTQFGSEIATDRPFMDPKWIGLPAKFCTFRPHKDRRWTDFGTDFSPHMDRTFLSIYQGPSHSHLPSSSQAYTVGLKPYNMSNDGDNSLASIATMFSNATITTIKGGTFVNYNTQGREHHLGMDNLAIYLIH